MKETSWHDFLDQHLLTGYSLKEFQEKHKEEYIKEKGADWTLRYEQRIKDFESGKLQLQNIDGIKRKFITFRVTILIRAGFTEEEAEEDTFHKDPIFFIDGTSTKKD